MEPPAVDNLDELARQFRAAIAADNTGKALRFSSEYITALAALWNSLSVEERQQARELMAWARESTIIHRTILADQLAMVRKASHYQPSEKPNPASFIL